MALTSRGIEVTLTDSMTAEVLAEYDVFRTKRGWVYRPKSMASDNPWRSPEFADRNSAIADCYVEMLIPVDPS